MPEEKLPLSFFSAYDTCTLAKKLLGCELVHESPDGLTSGIIVETEAYLQDDPACHAFNRRTARTEPMYGVAGTAYVYLIYGMYQCFNIVSNAEGVGEAVLIRALQPAAGVGLMEMRRLLRPGKAPGAFPAKIAVKELCRGPGKLVRAMGIERAVHNGTLLSGGNLYLRAAASVPENIVAGPRIGINVGRELPYRYYIKDNIFVSKG
ncbi:DNA-3-methyladenine glycosylase [Dyadobacter sp. 676]|uniref:Putative 3-methyladenine DNA glycosylase n=1 Tax=Dyadobacter sp. 676 TaxID=3088362 RepID=A0AAU8FKH0_9BACT